MLTEEKRPLYGMAPAFVLMFWTEDMMMRERLFLKMACWEDVKVERMLRNGQAHEEVLIHKIINLSSIRP